MNTIKIFTECGKTIGFGHISRCLALYQVAEQQGSAVKIYVYSDRKRIDLLVDKAHAVVNWREIDYLRENLQKNDRCIVDSYLAGQEIIDFIADNSKQVLFIDDYNRLVYPKGKVVNPCFDIGNIKYNQNKNTEYYWGHDYVILRDEFRNKNARVVRETVRRVLVMLGGTDIRNLIPLIIASVCNSHGEINFDIVIGGEAKNSSQLPNIGRGNICVHKNLPALGIKRLMEDADMAISAAGQTIYELLVTRTPFIAVKIAENQANNINALKKYNLLNDKPLAYDDVDFVSELEKQFEVLLDYSRRKKLADLYGDVIDGKGSERIIKLVSAN